MVDTYSNNPVPQSSMESKQYRLLKLIIIVVVIAIVGSVIIYQIRNVEDEKADSIVNQSPEEILLQQKNEAVSALEIRMKENPPVSKSEKDMATQEMNKRLIINNK